MSSSNPRLLWRVQPLLTVLLIAAIIFTVVGKVQVMAGEFQCDFSSPLDNSWTVYRQQQAPPSVDSSIGMPAPSLVLPPASSSDPPGFGDDVNSVFLYNPNTATLSNFTFSFWIYFDNDVGRAIVTFRMQDDRNYYGILVADTHDWTTRIIKLSNDQINTLTQTSAPGIFAPQQWSHVKIEVYGHTFTLYKDDVSILTANDETWLQGRVLGIGIYNEFNYGTIHIDSVDLSTSEPLNYVKVITNYSSVTASGTTTVVATSTQLSISFTTAVSTVPRPVVVDVTSFNTTIVPVFLPAVDLNSTLTMFAIGAAVGFLLYTVKLKESIIFAVISSLLSVIFTGIVAKLSVIHSVELGGAVLIGVLVGCMIRNLVGRPNMQQEDSNYS